MRRYENVKIENLKPYKNNARTHSEEQVNKIAKSIEQFGFVNPVLIDGNFGIIAGHGRVMAAKQLGMTEVPCIFVEDLTETQKRAYILADNKLALDAGWDNDILIGELEALKELNFDITLAGFDVGDIKIDIEQKEVKEDDFEAEPPADPKAKLGDIYQLGEHRLMCGDSTKQEDIEKLMNGKLADLVFTDPPYGMKKENDGVANDNLNYDDLLEFNKKWIPITFNNLKDNGSWYCWGIDEPLMDIYSNILKPMINNKEITFRNLITWNKGAFGSGGGTGVGQAIQRSYFPADEKCLFVMCGVQGFNNNADNYFEGWEPIRSYLEGEAKKVGLTNNKLKEICGVGMYGHWFTKSQFTLIPKEHYLKLQNYYKGKAFTKPYDDGNSIKTEYEKRKAEYYSTRAYFDNTHDMMTNIWEFNRVKGKEREMCGGHATPKPIALCTRAIKSSSREKEIVLDVFGGSGSTLIACEQLNRKCYMLELEPKWVDVIIERWEKYTGQKAIKIN